jgi:hypothetical protein
VDQPPEGAALDAELLRLTEAMLAAARAGDDASVAALAERREAVVAAFERVAVPVAAAARVAECVRRVLALDREVLGLVQARTDAARQALDTLAARRRSLQSYRKTPPTDPLMVERLG